ncbi:hypothetical protein J7K97_02890 [Candidatus Aerophobetes bacterium]|nr:hypothetical protein [Candidatus Aerophobetes bacterium]
MDTVKINGKEYRVIKEPQPHILVPTKKQLHGWWPGKRECTAERLLVNPYNGCGIGCFFCYTLSFPGYFQLFREKGIITVAKDFDREVAKQLDSIDVASCGYLSPVTDPFQPVNSIYRLSEKIIKVFVERNIPIEFITKAKIPPGVIEIMKSQSHCFGQVSILTPEEKLRKILVPGGATTDKLFENIELLSNNNIFSVCRIDPIFPFITDNMEDIKEIIQKAKDSGCTHIVASCLDIPLKIFNQILNVIDKKFGTGYKWDYRKLYRENIDGYMHADINYRKKIFDRMRNICERKNLTFALCMEYELIDGKPQGLNREFMSSTNCEGVDIPVYIRKGDKFYPAANCKGNCLNCTTPECGIPDLAMGKGKGNTSWKLKDYRRWSKNLRNKMFEFKQ